MSRRTVLLDRVVLTLIGLVVIALGVAMAAWWLAVDRNVSIGGTWTSRLSTAELSEYLHAPWWPWAITSAGVVMILLGLRWLLAHQSRNGIDELRLDGSGPSGQLVAAAPPIMAAAAQWMTQIPGVRSASGRFEVDRGTPVGRLDVTVEPRADLERVSAACAAVNRDIAVVLQRPDVHCQVVIDVARRGRALPRVE